jgi:hypothetical protein
VKLFEETIRALSRCSCVHELKYVTDSKLSVSTRRQRLGVENGSRPTEERLGVYARR